MSYDFNKSENKHQHVLNIDNSSMYTTPQDWAKVFTKCYNARKEMIIKQYLKPINVYKFIEYVENNPKEFKHYCEIIINETGQIYLARPSHEQVLLALASEKNKMSMDEYYSTIDVSYSPSHWIISKEKFIAVWYKFRIEPMKTNKFQQHTIGLLLKHGIILDSKTSTDEYQKYLKRKEL